jgi:hypothetical protein
VAAGRECEGNPVALTNGGLKATNDVYGRSYDIEVIAEAWARTKIPR